MVGRKTERYICGIFNFSIDWFFFILPFLINDKESPLYKRNVTLRYTTLYLKQNLFQLKMFAISKNKNFNRNKNVKRITVKNYGQVTPNFHMPATHICVIVIKLGSDWPNSSRITKKIIFCDTTHERANTSQLDSGQKCRG